MWWHVLGVTPTDDEKAVKKAYAALIKQVNQDNEIEMFTKVHHAFREALKDIRHRIKEQERLLQDEAPSKEIKKNSTKHYLEELSTIYNDPERRFMTTWWKNVFDCMSFNEEVEFHDRYVDFFNTHPYLTTEVWELIEQYYPLKRQKGFKWQLLIHGELEILNEQIQNMSHEQSTFFVESKIKVYYYLLEGFYEEAYELLTVLLFEIKEPSLHRWLMIVAIELNLEEEIKKAYELMNSDGKNEQLATYYYGSYLLEKGDYQQSLNICEAIDETHRTESIQTVIDQNHFFLYQQMTSSLEGLPWLELALLTKKDKLLIQKGHADKLIKQEQSNVKGRGWWKR